MESTPSRENLRTMTHSFMRSIQSKYSWIEKNDVLNLNFLYIANQATDFTLQVKTEKSFILMEKETLQSNLMAMKIVLIVFLSQFQKSLWLDHGTEQLEFGTPKQVNAFTFWRVISMLFQSWVFQTELWSLALKTKLLDFGSKASSRKSCQMLMMISLEKFVRFLALDSPHAQMMRLLNCGALMDLCCKLLKATLDSYLLSRL